MARHQLQHAHSVALVICTCWAITASAAAGSSSLALARPARILLQEQCEQLQCGGMSNCGSYKDGPCIDQVWPKYQCPSGYFCNRQNKWYWLCLPDDAPTARQPSAPAPETASPWWPPTPQAPALAPDSVSAVRAPATDPGALTAAQPWQLWWCRMGTTGTEGSAGTWYWQCVPAADNVNLPPISIPVSPNTLPATTMTPNIAPATPAPPTIAPIAPAPAPATPAAPTTAPTLTPTTKPLSKPFPLTGTNSYYLLTWSADVTLRPAVLETLDGAVSNGFKVLRIWAFADGPGWNSLQPKPGVYNAAVLSSLDWLLSEADKRGLQFMMTLTNSWPDYGGTRQYVRWANGLADNADVGNKEFFYNTKARGYFRNFAQMIVTRYRANPAVHSWDICNQPRADGDKNGVIAKWVAETAAFVKALDNKHPVTVGVDGFFGPSTPELLQFNPYNQDSGNDAVEECKHVDFCSFHMYPNSWRGTQHTAEDQASWAVRWIDAHIQASQKYLNNKPILLTEYSIQPAGATRELMFQRVSERLVASIKNKEPFVGAMPWFLASPAYPADGYIIRTNENSKQLDILRAMNAVVLAAIG